MYSKVIPYEWGFSILIWGIGIINKNPQFIMFIMSCINIIPVVIMLKNKSNNFVISIYLYITMMLYYSAFNGIRQWIASVLLFCSLKYVIRKNLKKYIICVIIATTIHISALIMLPVYFIVNFKPFGKKFMLVIGIFIILSFTLIPILSNFSILAQGTKYEAYTTQSAEDDGVNIFRVLVASIPVLISFFWYSKLKAENENRILINYSVLNVLIWILALTNTYMARFTMYFELYNLLLYPKIINILKKNEKYVFVTIMCLCFFLYMSALLPVDSNLLPYVSVFNK